MPTPWTLAGALAAAYELGILQKVLPGAFEGHERDVNSRTGIFAGLAGYGLGAHAGQDEAASLRGQLERSENARRAMEMRMYADQLRAQHDQRMNELRVMMENAKRQGNP